MYTFPNPTKVEYKVRERRVYYVTRYSEGGEAGAGSSSIGEYTSADTAYAVGYALAKAEHERLGWPVDDERIMYPEHPNDPTADGVSASPGQQAVVMYGI